MEFVLTNPRVVGGFLTLFISIYFLFRLGIRLSAGSFGENEGFAWFFTFIAVFFGLSALSSDSPIGYLGFIPILTYILLQILGGVNFSYDTKNKIKGVAFSGIASAVTYSITHVVFGFGIAEASLSAFVAAAILGAIGYNA